MKEQFTNAAILSAVYASNMEGLFKNTFLILSGLIYLYALFFED